jgi:hypothetical protein
MELSISLRHHDSIMTGSEKSEVKASTNFQHSMSA